MANTVIVKFIIMNVTLFIVTPKANVAIKVVALVVHVYFSDYILLLLSVLVAKVWSPLGKPSKTHSLVTNKCHKPFISL